MTKSKKMSKTLQKSDLKMEREITTLFPTCFLDHFYIFGFFYIAFRFKEEVI